MWDSVLHKDTDALALSNNFKLTETRVPQDVDQAPKPPMMQFFQNAVEFDAKLEKQLQKAAADKKLASQKQAAETGAESQKNELVAYQQPKTAQLVQSQSAQLTGLSRTVNFLLAAKVGDTGAPSGYNAQGVGTDPDIALALRPGSLLDVLA